MEVVSALLASGADPNTRNKYGDTLLHRAAGLGRVEGSAALLEAGADPNAQNQHGDTPLHRAAWRGHVEVVDVLHASGANLNVQNRLGYTALHCAAEGNHDETIHRLLDAGADPNLLAQHCQTPVDRWNGEKSDAFRRLNSAINGDDGNSVPTRDGDLS